jgi:hypothetical protein
MVPDLSTTSLGLEYFCNKNDDFWNMSDAELIELAKHELERIGLANSQDVVDGCVFRVPKAYPVYDADYEKNLRIVRQFIDSLENFQTVGRNGLHRYNNQDHSMLTAMLAVRNIVFGENNDLWAVNSDLRYHEEVITDQAKKVERIFDETITRVFPRLDPVSFGLATGITGGLLIFIATLFLVLHGTEVVGTYPLLLQNFLPGFTVSLWGALVGLLEILGLGFIFGSLAAYCRNIMMFLSVRMLYRDVEMGLLRQLFDFL